MLFRTVGGFIDARLSSFRIADADFLVGSVLGISLGAEESSLMPSAEAFTPICAVGIDEEDGLSEVGASEAEVEAYLCEEARCDSCMDENGEG